MEQLSIAKEEGELLNVMVGIIEGKIGTSQALCFTKPYSTNGVIIPCCLKENPELYLPLCRGAIPRDHCVARELGRLTRTSNGL